MKQTSKRKRKEQETEKETLSYREQIVITEEVDEGNGLNKG